ncbi:OmpA family protein [Falsiroseomonas selenitidurans]|uniref:OmpA family protein n=1 Tax=Falsiroseomonas selenitidurans TaxID=2716335 RepID=A0ABX1EFT7_9PROT|nr:OmpA family protein [Falsiroseomonas selenitidurans]NKC34387.1 OmpA family protein [Falsiroseomonas selenitidurans]
MIPRRALPALLLTLPVAPARAAGLAPRAEGGWQLAFPPGEATLDAEGRAALARLVPPLAAQTAGRITVEAQVSSPVEDASSARRLSLARARAVREALVAAGLDATRVDIRALGRLDPPADIAEILPPGVPRRTR